MKCVYPTVEDLDNVYVYLMDGKKAICFWKGEVKDFQNPNPDFKWLPF